MCMVLVISTDRGRGDRAVARGDTGVCRCSDRMLGIGHLRGHETNRLEALVTEITRIGGEARELEDGIEITPVPVERLHGEVMDPTLITAWRRSPR